LYTAISENFKRNIEARKYPQDLVAKHRNGAGRLPDCDLQTGISASPDGYRGCISAGHLPECFLQTGMSSAAGYLHAPS